MGGWLGLCSELETSTSIVNAQDKLRNDLVSLEEEIKRLQGQQQVTIDQLRLLNTQRQVQDSLVGLLQEDSLQLAFSLDSLQREEVKTHNEYERLRELCRCCSHGLPLSCIPNKVDVCVIVDFF